LKSSRVVPVLVVGIAFGCVKVQPATDTGGITSAAGPSTLPSPTSSATPATPATPGSSGSTATTALAYTPDLQPVFASDCLSCHNDRSAARGYSMSSYAAVMRAVTPGSASSLLVQVTKSNGSMYRYWTGDRATKASMTLNWVVANKAAQSR
jgi:hypothetical protein